MSVQGWVESLAAAPADGAALSNTVTATSLLAATAKPILPGQYFSAVGKYVRLTATGRFSTVVTSPGTFLFDVRFGSTVIWTGGQMSLNTTAQTNATFKLDILLVCKSIGSGTSATVLGVGEFKSRAVIGSGALGATGCGVLLLPDTAPVAGTGFDSTTAQTVDLFGTWNTANAANSITVHEFLLESLN